MNETNFPKYFMIKGETDDDDFVFVTSVSEWGKLQDEIAKSARKYIADGFFVSDVKEINVWEYEAFDAATI